MNKGTVATLLFMLSCCWLASPALSQGVGAALDIPLIERPPELEDFLGMGPSAEIRSRTSMVSGFIQRVPDDGAPASQRTEVYIAYDSRNLLTQSPTRFARTFHRGRTSRTMTRSVS